MAKQSVDIVQVLRQTARALAVRTDYQWGHMGSCNCGFLAQQVTRLQKNEIHERAMQGYGDWNEQLNDYCPTSTLPMDNLISELLAFGFDIDDLKHLERLSDPDILCKLPANQRNLKHNVKSDVILYLTTWANSMETDMLRQITLPDFRVAVNVPAEK